MLRQFIALLMVCWLPWPTLAQSPMDEPPATEEETEIFQRTVPVIDPGAHTNPICAMGFTLDKSRLITVGEDFSIQIWSTSTGERLDILRLFPYGRTFGDTNKSWDVGAVSPDGRRVALGGGPRISKPDEGRNERTKLVLVDLVQRSIRVIKGVPGIISALAFSPDGSQLAIASSTKSGEIQVHRHLDSSSNRQRRRRNVVTLQYPQSEKSASQLIFSPDGKRLLSVFGPRNIGVWDLDDSNPRLVKFIEANGVTSGICWSSDGTRIIRTYTAFGKNPHGLQILTQTGEQVKDFHFADAPELSKAETVNFVRFISPDTLLMHGYGGSQAGEPRPHTFTLNLMTMKVTSYFDEASPGKFPLMGALSHDGELAAVTMSMGLDAVVYRVKENAVVCRCGSDSPIPTQVGWINHQGSDGIAWSEERKGRGLDTVVDDLRYAFDFEKMEPVLQLERQSCTVALSNVGDWSAFRIKGENAPNQFTVHHQQRAVTTLGGGNALTATTLIPRKDQAPLLAWAVRWTRTGSAGLTLSSSDGKTITKLLPNAVLIPDIAPAPDGRYVVVSTGTHRMCIYPTNGEKFPILTVARIHGEWIVWSNEGYYAASPGGEKMIGWAVSNGSDNFATFYTADHFAKHFRRPDILRRAIKLGSLEMALKQGETRAPKIDEILPPLPELKLVKQAGSKVQLLGTAKPGSPDKPVVGMSLLLDGKLLARSVGTKVFKNGEPATATWELEISPGEHSIKLQARNEDTSAVTPSLSVKVATTADQKPVLHRICIGVDHYQIRALNLTTAAQDARDVYAALEKHCVGEKNRFGKSTGFLLLDQQATSATVLNAVEQTRKIARPNDLVVIHFAGHGVKQNDEYFLMTHEANPNEKLQGRSVSGSDLRQALAKVDSPVLLLLDSYHAAAGVKSFRPATDDLSRDLTDEIAGVTVLAAAMSHEVATGTNENGHFTAALLKALQAGQGVPYDPYDHLLYTHHIYSVIFSEVRKASNGKQNPFLNTPITSEPLAVRTVITN